MTTLTLVLLGSLATFLSRPAVAREDSFEPNDTPEQATSLPASTPLESWISTSSDEDWYVFQLNVDQEISILVSSVPADYDAELYWVNPSNSQFEFIAASEGEGTSNEGFTGTAQAAVYYVVVYGFEGANNPNDSYLIQANYTGGGGNVAPTVSVVAPNGGEQWMVGSVQQVQLTLTDPDDSQLALTLEYSTNGGTNWSPITSGNFAPGNFSFGWTIPNQPSTQARVRATVNDGEATGTDTSNANFAIVGAPTGTNTLDVTDASGASGTQVTIGLTLANESVVKGIQTDLLFNNTVATFVGATATSRGLGMTVDAQTGSTGARVVMAFENTSTLAAGAGTVANLTFQLVGGSGTSTNVTLSGAVLSGPNAENLSVTTGSGILTVSGGGSNTPPAVTVVSPNGGETLVAGSQHTIQYTATDANSDPLTIGLEYSTNAGTNWNPIASGLSNTGSFAWTVPNTATTSGRVRVTANDGQASTTDQSNASFTITTTSGGNQVALGSAAGANGETVMIPVTLTNDSAVKAIQFDVTMGNTSVASFLGASAAQRGLGMTVDAQAGPTGARVVLFFENASTLPAGSGVVANLSYRLTGAQNSSSTLVPASIVLSDPDANPLTATGVNGSINVTTGPKGAPALQVVALKNPGRTRTVQVFVVVENGSGSPPTVTAGGQTVSMTAMGGGRFQGLFFANGSASNVTITANDTNGAGTGTGSVTVTF